MNRPCLTSRLINESISYYQRHALYIIGVRFSGSSEQSFSGEPFWAEPFQFSSVQLVSLES